MKHFAYVAATWLTCSVALAQTQDGLTSGSAPALASPYATQSVAHSPKVKPFPGGKMPKVPEGFTVNRFADGLDSPRNVLVLPNGDVLAAEAKTERKYDDPQYRDAGANRITLLRDANGDGVAETRSLLLAGLRQPYGMALLGDRLYIADTDGVYWVPFKLGTTKLDTNVRKTRIASFEAGGYNNHWTRNIIPSADGRSLFVAVGSASNVGEHGMAAEHRRANILQIDLASGKEIVFGSGLRNPVGMAIEPKSGALWTAVNERDELGDDLVPDYITSVRAGGFYGWPYSYYGQNEDPRLKGQRPDLVAKALAPDYAVGAHVAALGIAFGERSSFPASYKSGAFVARHGSWNRSKLAGYDVVFVPFANGKPSGALQPFLTGFIGSEEEVYGRPRGVAIAKDGSLLVVDDAGGTLWRVAAVPHRAN
ncbi:PQQ-dependent sugar dehydrogenase [Sphingomonas xinjiangensis]|uniref:Glucose/arabinose dehydrogenase n=1 Tax=Sphingomonas xinjiangensis TaxID=643568 RepID=A0A840YS85_9SPHN|nr:sorbosone dehydrogenase family protein [Sphingomonas xinjiangensis]MBB5712534.1 glucose/arabinose dehydrogenase [Sphingomonas xinjiangensis]